MKPMESAELRLARAADPRTPAAELARLAGIRGPGLRERVASNPSTPLETLLRLASALPAEVAHNEGLPLLLMAQPDALSRCSRDTLAAMALRDPPAWLRASLFELLAAHLRGDCGGWAADLVRDPDTPAELLTIACACRCASLRRAAVRHNATPARVIELLVKAGSTPSLGGSTSRPPAATEAELSEAAALGPWGAELAASHPQATAALLWRLAELPDAGVRCAVARNPVTPEALMRKLHGEDDTFVAAARSPALPLDLLRETARLRGWLVADRAGLPLDVLEVIARGDQQCRCGVARNPELPPRLLDELASDPSPLVRRATLFNRALPRATLERLSRDELSGIREPAAALLADPSLDRDVLLGLRKKRRGAPARSARG